MAMIQRHLFRAIASAIVLAPAVGCSRSDHWIPDSPPAQPAAFYRPASMQTAVPEQLVEYRTFRLSPGDVVEIIYSVRNEVTDEPYQLKIEDRIRLAFPYQKQFDQEVTVGGDGNIRCLLIGGIRAAGYTASDLELQLKERYKAHLKEPELTVIVGAANVKIDELKKAITTAPRGQSRLVPIKPDGTIDLPYVGECFIAGKTVQESKEFLDKKYAEADLPEVAVTVQALEFAPKHIFVGGEVHAPGMILAQAPITLVQALFQLGGANARADVRNIMLVRRKYQPIPEAILFDLESVLAPKKRSASKFRQDIYLEDGDIIYVPPTELAKTNDWIDQVFTHGIRAVVPYSAEVGLDFGYQIRQAPISVHH